MEYLRLHNKPEAEVRTGTIILTALNKKKKKKKKKKNLGGRMKLDFFQRF
jgi:hypothetical protein